MSLKRERKINFTQDENLFLADKYEEFKHVIDAQHKDANTNRKKKESWAEILQQHQARFTVERSLSDLKTKLGKLKTAGRECVMSQKKAKTATGGGKPPKDPSPAEQKILDLCADTPGFKGLQGAESGTSTSKNKQGEAPVASVHDEELGEWI